MEGERTIQFVGNDQFPEYHGGDHETGADLHLLPGDVVTVSATKAAQLEEDMPDLFEFDVDPDSAGQLDARTQLKRLRVDDLIRVGQALDMETDTLAGWTKPGTSKDSMIDAIEAKRPLDEVLELDDVRAITTEGAPA